jgi:4-amino-4-deoxy-L-arabinose transferase-like glycosyltransferase
MAEGGVLPPVPRDWPWGRMACLLMALLVAALAWAPDLALWPLQSQVTQMRDPSRAAAQAQTLLLAAAAALAVVALAWRPLGRATDWLLQRLENLSARRFWASIVLLAALPRLALMHAVEIHPGSDAAWYHAAAWSLALGDGLVVHGEPTAYRPPGYPALLALGYRAFTPDIRQAWFWGLLATAVLLVCFHALARHLHGETVARITTALLALYPPLVFMTGQALSDLVFLAGLSALLVWWLARPKPRWTDAALAGLAISGLTLVRGAGLVLLPVLALVLLAQIGPRRALLGAAVMALACAVGLTPWLVRNHAVMGQVTLGTNLGVNFYAGNRPGASGGVDSFDWPVAVLALPNEAHRDRALRDAALEFIVARPMETAALLPRKLMHLYAFEFEAASGLLQGHPAGSPARLAAFGVSQFAYGVVLALLLARVLSWSHPGRHPRGVQWVGWWVAAGVTALCLLTHGQDRYRLPILPWMVLEGAVWLAGRMARRGLVSSA